MPKLLFPASFTRVGAQTVAPFPIPWTICGEALIASKSCLQFAKKTLLLFLSYFYFFSLTRLGSPSLAQDRSSRPWQRSRGHPPHGTNNRPRRTAQGMTCMTRRTQFIYCKPREFIFTYKLAHGAISPTRLLYMKSH